MTPNQLGNNVGDVRKHGMIVKKKKKTIVRPDQAFSRH